MESGYYEIIVTRARKVIYATPMSGEHTANSLWGQEFRDLLASGEDIFILDLRDAASYAEGHIPGSVHMEFNSWAQPDNLARIPIDRRIAVICETGDKASQVTGGLRLLGYEALAVKTGIHGYSRSTETDELVESIRSACLPVRRRPPDKSWPETEGTVPFDKPDESEFKVLQARAEEVSAAAPDAGSFAAHIISPEELAAMLENPDTAENIFLLDLRREEDYHGVGHIPGAVQVDYEHALSEKALALLPADAKIITICYTGNLAAQLTTMLRMLGYDAAVLANGMVQWSRTPTAHQFLKDIESADGPLVRPEP